MRANELDSLHDTLGGGQVIDGPRARRAAAANARTGGRNGKRPRYVEYGESDIEDEDEEEDDDDEDARADEVENDLDELGAEAEGGTDDEDAEMEDAPPPPPTRKQGQQPKPPRITLKAAPKQDPRQPTRTKVTVKAPDVGPLKSVEDQEMEDDDDEEAEDDDEDDEELDDEEDEEESSELSEDEEPTTLNDANGMNEQMEDEEVEETLGIDDDDDEDLDDSDDETPGSGMGTPDPAKMTKRQRGRPEDQGGLMALDMAPQQRKVTVSTNDAGLSNIQRSFSQTLKRR